jgi:hypothetical protein
MMSSFDARDYPAELRAGPPGAQQRVFCTFNRPGRGNPFPAGGVGYPSVGLSDSRWG